MSSNWESFLRATTPRLVVDEHGNFSLCSVWDFLSPAYGFVEVPLRFPTRHDVGCFSPFLSGMQLFKKESDAEAPFEYYHRSHVSERWPFPDEMIQLMTLPRLGPCELLVSDTRRLDTRRSWLSVVWKAIATDLEFKNDLSGMFVVFYRFEHDRKSGGPTMRVAGAAGTRLHPGLWPTLVRSESPVLNFWNVDAGLEKHLVTQSYPDMAVITRQVGPSRHPKHASYRSASETSLDKGVAGALGAEEEEVRDCVHRERAQ